jgi:hypothetical protein
LEQFEPALAPDALPEGFQELYLREADGGVRPLLPAASAPQHRSPTQGPNGFALRFAGASSDFSRVFAEANDALPGATPAAPEVSAKEMDLYDLVAGEIHLENVLPGGAGTAPDAAFGSGEVLSSEWLPGLSHAISSDGSRVFWTDLTTGKLYLRENDATTAEVPDPGRCLASLPASEQVCFLAASSDGTRVLLSDGRIYNTDALAEPPVDLTEGAAGFLGLVGSSEDLSRVYFIDTAALTLPSDTNRQGAFAEAGKDNLYLSEPGVAHARYIATLAVADGASVEINGQSEGLGDWTPSPSKRLAQVTPDGTYLAFTSIAAVTGVPDEAPAGFCRPNTGPGQGAACKQVFEYDASANQLTCASCNPSGAPPIGNSVLPVIQPVGTEVAPPRSLTSGGRVYFNSFDTLSPIGGSVGLERVYEFEHAGQGTCTTPGGCVNLISSPSSNVDSSLLSAGETGGDVFFTTRAQLVPQVHDESVNLYDAREGGGFTETPNPTPCTGEGCRPPAPPPPPATSPLTPTFNGLGNLTPAPPPPPPPVKPLTRPQKLTKALAACHTKHNKAKRKACEAQAHRRYGPPHKAKKASHTATSHRGGK